jgi:AcrR family transcriptional regulator
MSDVADETPKTTDDTPSGEAPAADDARRAADGRVPGRRGRATRDRLTACTLNMLQDRNYRDLKVVDIAREAGTSPATFYQYFPDVESAILTLAEEMAEDGNDRLTRIVLEGDWKVRKAYETAESIADAYFSFWEDNSALMRVLDLTSLEGDERFRSIRTRLLNEFTIELSKVVAAQRDAGKHPADLDPMAVAGVLVSMLAHVAAHRTGFEGYDIHSEDVRRAMARIVFTSVCGTKPPR